MATRSVRMSWIVVLTLGLLGTWSPAQAQESESSPLAIQLSEMLTSSQLDSVASKDSIDDDRYVAALSFPGQLLVVSARYEVPLYVDEKIAAGQFREVYIDLNSASIAGTKVLVTDVGANGLLGDDAGVDMFDDGSSPLRLDGGEGRSASEYGEAVAAADQQYARMLRALIASIE